MILNFGSINIDNVYAVESLPGPGETISATSYARFLGGKGINQSIAIAKSGGEVCHIGAVGQDGDWVLGEIAGFGVDTGSIAKLDGSTGHAVVVVDNQAENQIVISGGTNLTFSEGMVADALSAHSSENAWVLLQNETNLASHIVGSAREAGYKIAYAAAPFVAETTLDLLGKVDLLAVNEGEARQLASALDCKPEAIPVPQLLITKGSSGSVYINSEEQIKQDAFVVDAVDTTGAGDTFLGSFLARRSIGDGARTSLEYAAAASALQVTREGAAPAIPYYGEVMEFIRRNRD